MKNLIIGFIITALIGGSILSSVTEKVNISQNDFTIFTLFVSAIYIICLRKEFFYGNKNWTRKKNDKSKSK